MMVEFSNTHKNEWEILANGTVIHKTALVYPGVSIGANCIIGEYVIIGRDNIVFYKVENDAEETVKTYIGNDCVIDAHSFISAGVKLGHHVVIARNTFIGKYTTIGNYTKCHYNAQIYQDCVIGNNCKIGGFCCNESVVGDYSNVYGTLGHKFKVRNAPDKKAPTIGNNVTIGIGSVVLENVIIQDKAYIAANAIVTKNVLEGQKVRNVNEQF